MNETPLYLKPYFFPLSSSQPLIVDTFSEVISRLIEEDETKNNIRTNPIKFPHAFKDNKDYTLFVQLLTTLCPGFHTENVTFLEKIGKAVTPHSESDDLLFHQTVSNNQTVSILVGQNALRNQILGFQIIAKHQHNQFIYSLTWNQDRRSNTNDAYKYDVDGHILCMPSTVTITPGFSLTPAKRLKLQPLPNACFAANASYFLFSLEKICLKTHAVALTYSISPNEQQFEHYHCVDTTYSAQTQSRALHPIDEPTLNRTLPWQEWRKNPHPTLYLKQPDQTPAFREPTHAATIVNNQRSFNTIIIQDNLHEIHQHPPPPIEISITKIYNAGIANNHLPTFININLNQKCGSCIKVTYNPNGDHQAQRISFSFGLFNQTTFARGTRFIYQLTSAGQYAVSLEHGLFSCDSTNALIHGKCTPYRTNDVATQLPSNAFDSTFFSQANTIFSDILQAPCLPTALTLQNTTSIGYLDTMEQKGLAQLTGLLAIKIEDQFKDIVQHQIARIHHCLDVTKTIATLCSERLESIALFNNPSKLQMMTEYQTDLIRTWRTLSHTILDKILAEEQQAWRSLIKKQTKSYLTLHSENFFKQKIDQAEHMLRTHEWIQSAYRTFFKYALPTFRSIELEKKRIYFLSSLPSKLSIHISVPQHAERMLLWSQFTQEKQDVLDRQLEALICTERLHRRFLMFSLANEYATDLTYYHKKQTEFEGCKLPIHGTFIHQQINRYLAHSTKKFPENNNQSIVETLKMAYDKGLIDDTYLAGSAARGSAWANDIDIKIVVKNGASVEDYQALLHIFRHLILASTKHYIRTDNALLTLEFMGPNGLPFNLVIFFIGDKKAAYPPLYQDDIIVRFNATNASWKLVHEKVDYVDQTDKRRFTTQQQEINGNEPAKIANVLLTQSFNMKRSNEPGAILRVLRDMTYFPDKKIYNEKQFTGIWQNYKDEHKQNIADMVVLFLEGDAKKEIPAKIHAQQKNAFKALASTYFPNWESHCGHQHQAKSNANAAPTFFGHKPVYYGIAAVIEKIGNANSNKPALEKILADIASLGIENAVSQWQNDLAPRSTSTFMHSSL